MQIAKESREPPIANRKGARGVLTQSLANIGNALCGHCNSPTGAGRPARRVRLRGLMRRETVGLGWRGDKRFKPSDESKRNIVVGTVAAFFAAAFVVLILALELLFALEAIFGSHERLHPLRALQFAVGAFLDADFFD